MNTRSGSEIDRLKPERAFGRKASLARYLYVPDHGCDHCTAAWSVCTHGCTIRPVSRGCNATASARQSASRRRTAWSHRRVVSRFKPVSRARFVIQAQERFRQVIRASEQARTPGLISAGNKIWSSCARSESLRRC